MSGNLIDKAIDYIHEHGWTKGKARDPQTGAVCAMGAVWGAQGFWQHDRRLLDEDEVRRAFDVLYEDLPSCPTSKNVLAAYNDDPRTTLEDVLLVMKKASARLDEQTS